MFNPVSFDITEQEIIKLNNMNFINRGTLKEVHIADVHFGIINPKTQYDILSEQFINKIEHIDFDILSINGDIYEHKFMANADPVMYAAMFMDRVVDICKRKNATLVVIAGTYHHDANQIKLFYHYLQDPSIDIRIVEEVKFEYIKGARILCIPELYGKGEEYYNNFLINSGSYDSVFMHGTIKGAIYGKDKRDLNAQREPVFSIDDFCLCKGPILSGHVHVPGCFNSHFYYCGSPLRWKYGEEQEKGFMIVLHNLDTRQYYVHLEPIKSFRYDTINIDNMLNRDPKEVIQYINELQQQGIDHIRVDFNMSSDEISNANIELIKNYYRTNNTVKIDAKDINKTSVNKEQELQFEKELEQYSFITDKNLSHYDILSRYINIQEGYTFITADELKKFMEEEF